MTAHALISKAAPARRAALLARLGELRWEPAGVAVLLVLTAALYLWNLAASGWANAYYAAAVEAGSRSWTAFFFGSFDASNFVTVDKPPAALWVMDLSARLFGVNSWSLLVPEALMGVATVALTYLAVRRWFGPPAGLLAGSVVALTPVAALMFRFNNPDALLTLLLTASTYTLLRGVEDGRTRWLLAMGALVGLAFLAKMLQGFVILPVLAGVYLLAGPPRLGRRLWQLVLAGAATLLSAGWWVAAVELTPASARPYIGGSQTNSLLELIFGYNGFGRLTGNETGSVGGGPVAGSMWGPTGWDRLFQPSFGGQVSWLIPAAAVLLVAGLVLTIRRPRTDLARASLIAWGGSLLVTGAVISFARGIIHPYYTIALAPAIGATVAIGAVLLWRRRAHLLARLALVAAVAAAAGWAIVLLQRTPAWHPELRSLIAFAAVAGATGLVAGPLASVRWLTAAGAAAAVLAALAGPAAYTLDTVLVAHAGAIPSAGPAVAGAGFGPRFAGPRPPGPPPAGFPGRGGFGTPGGPGGPGGGLLNSSAPATALTQLLQTDASSYRWAAATIGANSAAGYQLAADRPVMAIGGFNGTDPTPTLAQFQAYVSSGQVHYFIAGRGFGGPGGNRGTSAEIQAWVEANFTPQTVGGVTLYDLTRS